MFSDFKSFIVFATYAGPIFEGFNAFASPNTKRALAALAKHHTHDQCVAVKLTQKLNTSKVLDTFEIKRNLLDKIWEEKDRSFDRYMQEDKLRKGGGFQPWSIFTVQDSGVDVSAYGYIGSSPQAQRDLRDWIVFSDAYTAETWLNLTDKLLATHVKGMV